MAQKGGQIRELQDKLINPDLQVKQEAIRKIIDAMTRGKDVSMLFMDVVKNMQTTSLQLKKLIYLYVMNYAKNHPNLAISGINTFRKDAIDRNNPFLRGLAVRTMGCIRVKEITEYLCDPLKKALKDEDPYVRKTGVLCVPKLLEISPEMIEEQGFLKILENLLNDGNATVVSNAVASLNICSEIKGEPILKVTQGLVQKLLTAMNDCNQWGVVYILDTLATYVPRDSQQAQNIMQRVSSRLAHTNSAVALSSIKLIIKYMDYLTHPQSIRSYNNKISAPLITMIERQSQISYLVLKTINLVLQKRPLLLPKQLKVFFVKYQDPLYVKLEKLQVLSKIATNDNILMILHELKECVQEVDVEFVRRAIRTMGRCAIKLEKMADKCVQCLWETLKTKISYAIQEAVIVIRDIFRKYPNKYEGLLVQICDNLKTLDDPQAKASIIWIIGQYMQMIENANELMQKFSQNFKDEPDVVQQQILVSCMKLYLYNPSKGHQILKDLFKYITTECENPDLRDRGFIYWRLLSTDPKIAKTVILSERPLISDQSYTLQSQLLDKLLDNIGTLSGVYYKVPEDFVKRLKENANSKEIVDEDPEQLLANYQKQEVVVPSESNQVVSFANKDQKLVDNTPTMLQSVIVEPVSSPTKKVQHNLLEMDQPITTKQTQQNLQSGDLIDMNFSGDASTINTQINTPINTQINTPINTQMNTPMNTQINTPMNTQINTPMNTSISTKMPNQPIQNYPISNTINQSTVQQASNIVNMKQSSATNMDNIVIPMVEVLSQDQSSRQGKFSGLIIRAAFERQGSKVFLQMQFGNNSSKTLNDFALKLNANAFKFSYGKMVLELAIAPGEQKMLKLDLSTDGMYSQLQGWPYSIDCALKVADDVFIFKVPCSLSVAIVSDFVMDIQMYKQISSSYNCKKQDAVPNSLPVEEFVTKLKANNLCEVFRKSSEDNQLMSFGCQLTSGQILVVDIIFEIATNSVSIQMNLPNETIERYFNHALLMIVNL